MPSKHYYPILLVSLILLVASSCGIEKVEFDKIKIKPTGFYAVPLGKASFTISEFLKDQDTTKLKTDKDSLLSFIFSDTASFSSTGKFVKLEDVSRDKEIDLKVDKSFPPVPNDIKVPIPMNPITIEYVNETRKEVIDSVEFSEGEFEVELSSDLPNPIEYTVSLANIKKVSDQSAMKLSGTVPVGGTGRSSEPLKGYKTKFDSKPGETKTTFIIGLDFKVPLKKGQSLSQGTRKLKLTVKFKNQAFSVVYGKFGQDTTNVSQQTVKLDFLKEFGEGIKFGDPKINFEFESSFGIPMELDFSKFLAIDTVNNRETKLSGKITNETTRPKVEKPLKAGETKTSKFSINKDNSNIVELLSGSPSKISVGVGIISNPQGNNTANFVMPTSKIKTKFGVEVPFVLQFKNVKKSTEFDANEVLKDYDNIDSVFIRIASVNELPFSGKVLIEILDENGSVKYASPEKEVLKIPAIGSNLLVTKASEGTADIPIGTAGIEALKSKAKLKLTFVLNTPPKESSKEPFVKILSKYKLDLTVGVAVKLKKS